MWHRNFAIFNPTAQRPLKLVPCLQTLGLLHDMARELPRLRICQRPSWAVVGDASLSKQPLTSLPAAVPRVESISPLEQSLWTPPPSLSCGSA